MTTKTARLEAVVSALETNEINKAVTAAEKLNAAVLNTDTEVSRTITVFTKIVFHIESDAYDVDTRKAARDLATCGKQLHTVLRVKKTPPSSARSIQKELFEIQRSLDNAEPGSYTRPAESASTLTTVVSTDRTVSSTD